MNRTKRACALLLALVLALGTVLQPGVVTVHAAQTEQPEQTAEAASEPASEPAAEAAPEPASEPATEAASEPASEPATETASEPTTEPTEEPTTEPTTEAPTEEPTTEPTTEAPTEEPTTEPITEAPAGEPTTEPTTEAPTEPADGEETLSFYDRLMACGSLSDFDALLRAEENGLEALTREELTALLARVEALYAAIQEPTEADTLLKEALLNKLKEYLPETCPECGGEDGAHQEGCSALAPVCTCGSENGEHTLECPCYAAPVCTCGSEDGAHTVECPLYVCPECGEVKGHLETCPQYRAEETAYAWAALTDGELAAWLMDPQNAEAVKAILGSEGEEYDALMARVDAILSGEDETLAQSLQAYLSALTGLDTPETLEEPVQDAYIYFDLAAGNVTIGRSTYSGYIYVEGTATPVTGEHADNNKYYIYQSNGEGGTDTTSPGYYKNTGYKTLDDFTNHTNCQIPLYNRVLKDGTPWTDYITNRKDVYEVIGAWRGAAEGAKRTQTSNYITFKSESEYTANVTIDNIWTNYYFSHGSIFGVERNGTWRTTGGIGANLYHVNPETNTNINCENTHIYLGLKGDNRVSCVHYSARQGAGNTIEFYDSKIDSTPGSITVADFPEALAGNHWCSAIGGADNPGNSGDVSDGIVIHSGFIYAGTTPEDNCTAIGGGGNNYGGVTIKGGTVTAVVSSTGTAIGGGIGYSDPGGNTDVSISGGTIYAYNLGIKYKDKTWEQDYFANYIPAAAIGGGGSRDKEGNTDTNITITGGTVYAQSMGGPAIGGGGSAKKNGGPANITIKGGTVTAKSVPGVYNGTPISAGVGIGGGTGETGGGAVTLTVSGVDTDVQTGSIGGGKTTGTGTIGNATVTISGGKIKGQVIMAGTGDENKKCTFTMTDGTLYNTDVTEDNKKENGFYYLSRDGGAVWMDDTIGEAKISGGTIKGCTANRGGAIYMKGGTADISGGTIQGCNAQLGGAVYMEGGSFTLSRDGKISGNTAKVTANTDTTGLGGGVVVAGDGTVNMSGGEISGNIAESRGGGVYMPGGSFEMTGGRIDGNTAANGGGIFLTKRPALTGGAISGNVATDHGGGVCIDGKEGLVLANTEMQIYGNRAKNGGGVAVRNGSFTLNGGNMGVDPGTVSVPAGTDSANFAEKGGGVYVEGGSVTVEKGNVWYNRAIEGGGVYLAESQNGNFTLNGAEASISHNTATSGGGVYLYKNPLLKQGRIENNRAEPRDGIAEEANGGGMYISDCLVELAPDGDVFVTGNYAANDGGGIYIYGSKSTGGGSESGSGSESGGTENPVNAVDAVTGASPLPQDAVGLLAGKETTGNLILTGNTAVDHGGAVCIKAADDKSRFELDTDRVTVTGNQAQKGGGVAVLHGNFTMTAGAIGTNGGANTAENGGGVFVSNGQVWLKGGAVHYNSATNGGGVYVTNDGVVGDKDQFIMLGGDLRNNTAAENGGGGYVAGNFHMLGGTIGGDGGGNTAKNGGGIYVHDGDVKVVYGDISYNHAENGGGVCVSSGASARNVHVVMLSGSLSHNQAAANGGGMAVKSEGGQTVSVEIGCKLNHNLEGNGGKPNLPIPYVNAIDAEYGEYAEFGGITYQHESCPKVENNSAEGIGGGFYMDSAGSTLSFYCVEETNNTAKGSNTAGMDVVGGKVIIGDDYYHNHGHDGTLDQDQQHMVPWGYISMDDATLVNGGTVDIYGDMTNPIFRDEVTVDIHGQNDHFMDHRRTYHQEKHYKVHYIENFKEGDTVTGLYQAFQYDEDHTTITIEGTLYNRPGYTILGWRTESEALDGACEYKVGTTIDLAMLEEKDGMGTHSIDCVYCGANIADAQLLELYAIWEANGYTVVYNPNVPDGKTYTGAMNNQTFTYGVEGQLSANAYKYPGNIFLSWNTKADGSGTSYSDQATVSNLTAKNGAKVTLYAQWEKCDHTDKDRWSYKVLEDGKTIQRDCSCGGQTLKATLSAEDTVYDGNDHPATLTLDDKDAWGTDAPKIEYVSAWPDGDGLSHASGTAPILSTEGKPYHAGKYTASITKKNTVDGAEVPVKAHVVYTIAKADQNPPAKPTYTVPTDPTKNNQVVIDEIAPNVITDAQNRENQAAAQYRLSYYEDSKLTFTDWRNANTIVMQNAWTSYNVEARYGELEDYNPSEVVRADAVYHFTGNVTVKIICDEGIDAYFQAELNADKTFNGAKLKLTTQTGYYRVGGDYTVGAELMKEGDPAPTEYHGLTRDPDKFGEYSVTSVPDRSTLTITIGKARRTPQITAKVAPKQIFSSFAGTATTISRDSAFTAAFQVKNFDPIYSKDGVNYGAYTGLKLTFVPAIPANTTIILLDRRDSSYWYYRAGSGATEVPLTGFQKMGVAADEKYSIPTPEKVNGYIDLSYQFIVDFSQAGSGCTGDSLSMTLEAVPKSPNDAKAPDEKADVNVTLKDSILDFQKEPGSGLTGTFKCTFARNAAASKWDNRASALILTPKEGTTLPPDAQIKAEVGDETTYLYKTGKSFIIPLSLLQPEEKAVTLTLKSDLFPKEGDESYSFTVQWLVSPSRAGKSPMTGYEAGKIDNVTFTSPAEKVPSLKSSGTWRLLTVQDELNLTIARENLDGCKVSAALLRKLDDGTAYIGTGWNEQDVTGNALEVPLGGQNPGSFCLMLTVKKGSELVLEVPYYFVIKQTP